ncbi:MAG: hypothetical protein O7A09_10495 [Proteobacteria bacterium]|nr:hypothetical protein [Pseudomonadota bacterium]
MRFTRIACVLICALALPGLAVATPLVPGEILVLGSSAAGDGIIRVDPGSGDQTLLASSGTAAFTDFAVTGDGDLFATTADAVVQVDPMTGIRTTISSGGSIVDPIGIVAHAGALFVLTATEIVRVDVGTGVQTSVSSGGFIGDPRDLGVDASGDLIALDTVFLGGRGLELFTIDILTGDQTLIPALAASLPDPSGLGVADSGELLVSDFSQAQTVGAVDPITGNVLPATQSALVISTDTLVLDVAVDADGRLLIPVLVVGGPDLLVRAQAGGPGTEILTEGLFREVEVVPGSPVPEPTAAFLFGAGLLVARGAVRRRAPVR